MKIKTLVVLASLGLSFASYAAAEDVAGTLPSDEVILAEAGKIVCAPGSGEKTLSSGVVALSYGDNVGVVAAKKGNAIETKIIECNGATALWQGGWRKRGQLLKASEEGIYFPALRAEAKKAHDEALKAKPRREMMN